MPDEDDSVEGDSFPRYYRVTDVLDLHGFFPEQVPEMVRAFVENAVELRLSRLRIIHGKGKSKLKYLVRRELERLPEVMDFFDAPPEFGGWGATIVLLRLDTGNRTRE